MFRVTYPLISTDGSRSFATREEAEAFACKIAYRRWFDNGPLGWRPIQIHDLSTLRFYTNVSSSPL